jgi:signal transduction histidine kinase
VVAVEADVALIARGTSPARALVRGRTGGPAAAPSPAPASPVTGARTPVGAERWRTRAGRLGVRAATPVIEELSAAPLAARADAPMPPSAVNAAAAPTAPAVTFNEPLPRRAPAPAEGGDTATLRAIARKIRAGRDVLGLGDPDDGRPGAQLAAQPPVRSEPAAPAAPRPLAQADIAKLAHELRTPLAAIAALAEVMRDERLGPVGNPRYRGYAGDIHDSARHALDVLGAALEPGAPESRGGLVFAELDIGPLVEAAVSSLRPIAEGAGVTLATRLAPGLPRLVADRRSIRQILLNLLSNALKFTPAGGRIEVRSEHTLDGPLAIVVADTGKGMSATEIDRALMTSAEAEPRGTPSGGLGYGLALVRALAAANGGEVRIASSGGAGTEVSISFAKDRLVPV